MVNSQSDSFLSGAIAAICLFFVFWFVFTFFLALVLLATGTLQVFPTPWYQNALLSFVSPVLAGLSLRALARRLSR